MHKITKGLKKKKKGKKSKRTEEELFKPEELENYRREHQSTSEEVPAAQNEEWKKFLALTSGVDDILKKTQGDLDRIKSTSFFQRKPTESEVRKTEEAARAVAQQREAVAKEEPPKSTPAQLGIVEVSDSESEEEEDDGIFDTDYIDVIAAGEVKLAYIPESPTEKQDGDDPFDTSIAERAILGPEVERKGKKLVPLGAAVEVLTGRVQLPTCATKRPTSRRQVVKERDLLLGSFDDPTSLGVISDDTQEVKKTLLDEDPEPLPLTPIDLSKPIPFPQIPLSVTSVAAHEWNRIDEFGITAKAIDDDDIEFEALAAESLSKTPGVITNLQFGAPTSIAEDFKWSAFETEPIQVDHEIVDDPFDTTFAATILPDLKDDKTIFDEISSSLLVNGDISISGADENLIYSDDRITESGLNFIKPGDRDLLGGSSVDLSTSGSHIQKSAQETPVNPFGLNKASTDFLSDDEFNPRAEETRRERIASRPDILNIAGAKTVSFDIPSPNQTALNLDTNKIGKPLTPFYNRKNSIPELPIAEDPFDTSFAVNVAPGKAELKQIESELFDPEVERNLSLVDKNFDPRDETQAKLDRVVDSIKEISKPKLGSLSESIDLLAIDNEIPGKVLTPGDFVKYIPEELSYCDPFDTSIACNILPGRTELKILESELIFSPPDISLKKIDDLLIQGEDIVIRKPLSPSGESICSVIEQDDFDPFDTSCANNIQPGRAELKQLESELI